MAKRKRQTAARAVDAARADDHRKRLKRAEVRLAASREEAAKRTRQLETAEAKVVEFEHRVTALRAIITASHAHDGVGGPAQAYCMREKRMVAIADPEEIQLRNGRAAISGTCPDCGAHVVTMARTASAPAPETTAPPMSSEA